MFTSSSRAFGSGRDRPNFIRQNGSIVIEGDLDVSAGPNHLRDGALLDAKRIRQRLLGAEFGQIST